MKHLRKHARQALIDSIQRIIVPRLLALGFSRMEIESQTIPMWDFHRSRSDGGFDLLGITLDKRGQPAFLCTINTIDAEGITQPWGEWVGAANATASTPLRRVMLLKRREGLIGYLLPKWFGHCEFGFEASDEQQRNIATAEAVCAEYLACLPQAASWWKTGALGPNLVVGELQVVPRNASAFH